MNSVHLSSISITGHPEVSCDILLALKRRTLNESRVPDLEDLQVTLPEDCEERLSELDKLSEMLALTLIRRADFGFPLDHLLVSECLTTNAPWKRYRSEQIAKEVETKSCECETHNLNLATGSDGDEMSLPSD